jgi:thiamine-phosphate pyrophosphorylase
MTTKSPLPKFRRPRSPESWRLYAILDTGYFAGRDPADLAAQMIEGGVDIIQLRAKGVAEDEVRGMARSICSVTRRAGIPLIVNDHPRVAKAVKADGVHIGQDDGTIASARAIIGGKGWVGRSTHTLDQALEAEKEGADCIGVGPVFATPTKPEAAPVGLDLVRLVAGRVRIPFFCIGGIKLENAPEVIAAGGRRIVVVSGILQAPDLAAYCRSLKKLLVDD